jgi:hypothetical protein
MGQLFFALVGDYPAKTYKVYDKILNNPVGKVIVDGIKATSRDLTFKPRTQTDIDKYGVCDAGTAALDPLAAYPKGVGGNSSANLYKGIVDDVKTLNVDEGLDPSNIDTKHTGTGAGSSVEIGFDPDNLSQSCINRGPGSQPDESLLHEMVHALRMMQGQYNPVPTANRFYDDEEEFLAIVVTNVYISQKDGAALLRGEHRDHERLWPPLNTSAGFVANKDNKDVLQNYRSKWLPTFTNLAKLVTPQFNPFREVK